MDNGESFQYNDYNRNYRVKIGLLERILSNKILTLKPSPVSTSIYESLRDN